MKQIKCYECEETFKAETREDMLNALYAHYMEKHPEVIPNATDADKKAWMEKFETDWVTAEEA